MRLVAPFVAVALLFVPKQPLVAQSGSQGASRIVAIGDIHGEIDGFKSILKAAGLTDAHFGTAIALLFIASMVAIGVGFAVFLVETRVGSRAVRIRSELLAHEAADDE